MITSATDVHTICYISNANVSLVATQLARLAPVNNILHGKKHHQRERDAKRRAGCDNFEAPPMGVLRIVLNKAMTSLICAIF